MVYIELTKKNGDLHIYMYELAKLMQINPISVGFMEVVLFMGTTSTNKHYRWGLNSQSGTGSEHAGHLHELTENKDIDCRWPIECVDLPSGKDTKNHGKIHHVSWVSPLFQWAIFNSKLLVYQREHLPTRWCPSSHIIWLFKCLW